ncbi:MAG: hypothetical protein IKE81_06005 [Clostridia bacterium]|nr:hypothetical protein [Clostridia bacterium]
MKKVFALILVVCMLLTSVSVFAETTEKTPADSGLGDLLSGLMGGSDSGDSKGLSDLLGGLMGSSDSGDSKGLSDLLGGLMGGSDSGNSKGLSSLLGSLMGGEDGKGLSGLIASLKKELQEGGKLSALVNVLKEQLKDPNSKLASLLARLKSAGDADLGTLLGSLLGGGSTGTKETPGTKSDDGTMPALTPEEEADLEAAFMELATLFDKAAQSDPHPVSKKEAAKVEDFYGDWTESKLYIGDEETDLASANEGLLVNEKGAFFTENGEISKDYDYPETMEMKLEKGELLVGDGQDWMTYTLTEDGSLVLGAGTSIQIHYVPASK